MDIQKEMAQYENILSSLGYGHRSLSKSDLGYLNPITQFGFEIWYESQKAAKAQAVPEGFVLIEKAKLMQIIGSVSMIEPITRGNPYMDSVKRELTAITDVVKTVIEPQEPAK